MDSNEPMTMPRLMHVDGDSVAARMVKHEKEAESMLDAREEADRKLEKCIKSTAYRMAVAEAVHATLCVVEMLARCGDGSWNEDVTVARYALDSAAGLAGIQVDFGFGVGLPKPSGHGGWDSALAVYMAGDSNGKEA